MRSSSLSRGHFYVRSRSPSPTRRSPRAIYPNDDDEPRRNGDDAPPPEHRLFRRRHPQRRLRPHRHCVDTFGSGTRQASRHASIRPEPSIPRGRSRRSRLSSSLPLRVTPHSGPARAVTGSSALPADDASDPTVRNGRVCRRSSSSRSSRASSSCVRIGAMLIASLLAGGAEIRVGTPRFASSASVNSRQSTRSFQPVATPASPLE